MEIEVAARRAPPPAPDTRPCRWAATGRRAWPRPPYGRGHSAPCPGRTHRSRHARSRTGRLPLRPSAYCRAAGLPPPSRRPPRSPTMPAAPRTPQGPAPGAPAPAARSAMSGFASSPRDCSSLPGSAARRYRPCSPRAPASPEAPVPSTFHGESGSTPDCCQSGRSAHNGQLAIRHFAYFGSIRARSASFSCRVEMRLGPDVPVNGIHERPEPPACWRPIHGQAFHRRACLGGGGAPPEHCGFAPSRSRARRIFIEPSCRRRATDCVAETVVTDHNESFQPSLVLRKYLVAFTGSEIPSTSPNSSSLAQRGRLPRTQV